MEKKEELVELQGRFGPVWVAPSLVYGIDAFNAQETVLLNKEGKSFMNLHMSSAAVRAALDGATTH